MKLDELEPLLETLKKHRVLVFQCNDIKLQFAPQAFVQPADPVEEKKKLQGDAETNDEREAVLFAASGG